MTGRVALIVAGAASFGLGLLLAHNLGVLSQLSVGS